MKKEEGTIIYPLVFSTIAVERMWGGDFIKNLLEQHNISSNYKKGATLGELWLVSDRKNEQSIVKNGALKGLTLNELWLKFSKNIFGIEKPNKNSFPLLIKIIDAGEDLSLQVHPKEENLDYLKGAEAKTEMWYIIDHKNEAQILAGFNDYLFNKEVIDSEAKEEFFKSLNTPKELKKMVKHFSAKNDQYFFIPAGTIHAIGKGNLIFEIQQNSDTTYRVSDWGRVDSSGKSRELHIDESMKCINFNSKEVYNSDLGLDSDSLTIWEKEISPKNPYFKLFAYCIDSSNIIDTSYSYKLLTVINGELEIKFNNNTFNIPQFSTVLLPFGFQYTLNPKSHKVKFLSYYAL